MAFSAGSIHMKNLAETLIRADYAHVASQNQQRLVDRLGQALGVGPRQPQFTLRGMRGLNPDFPDDVYCVLY